MGYSISKFKANFGHAALQIGDDPNDVIEVDYNTDRLMDSEWMKKFMAQANSTSELADEDLQNANDEFIHDVSSLLREWDLLDDAGQPVGTDEGSIRTLPPGFVGLIIGGVMLHYGETQESLGKSLKTTGSGELRKPGGTPRKPRTTR